MKRAMVISIIIFPLLLLVGCETTKITITADPDDAKIYVDGEYIGEGIGSYDTKQSQFGGSKELSVVIKHPDYKTLNTTIDNKWDTGYALGIGALGLGLGGLIAYEGGTSPYQSVQSIDYGLAAVEIGCAAWGMVDSYKFNKSYHFELVKKEGGSGE